MCYMIKSVSFLIYRREYVEREMCWNLFWCKKFKWMESLRRSKTAPFELFMQSLKKKSTKRWRSGKKKETTCLAYVKERATGHSATCTGPRWLFFNFSFWTVRHPSLLSSSFHFMLTLAGSLTSCFSFFIMFVSAWTVLSGKAHVGRESCPRIRERPDQVSSRQAGKEGREGRGGTQVIR